MLDIILFRDPKTADIIRESQRRRFKDVSLVDAVIELDAEWRLGMHPPKKRECVSVHAQCF
jgi:hypothetical protein